jgi:ribA/ribD-fused uncharacterized protein
MITEFNHEFIFLSNFYWCEIQESTTYFDIHKTKLNLCWPSAEHFYQSLKTNNLEEKLKILRCNTSSKAKKLGSKLTLIPNWDKIKIEKMKLVVTEKFKQNLELKELLIETYPEKLMEGNYWHDNFWGKCFCDVCKQNIAKNMLGIILMQVRQNLIEENKNGSNN